MEVDPSPVALHRARQPSDGRGAARARSTPTSCSSTRTATSIRSEVARAVPGQPRRPAHRPRGRRGRRPARASTRWARTLAALAGAVVGGERRRGAGASALLGVVSRDFYFRFREPTHLSREGGAGARGAAADATPRAALRARGRNPRLQVLLTGATGFLGKEILAQAADDRRIDAGRGGGAAGDDPRPQDEGGREGPVAAAARRAAAEAAAHHGRAGAEVPLRGRRHREARPGHRRRRSWPRLRTSADPRHPLRGQRLLRRPLRELLPRQRARLPQRARLLAAACSATPGSRVRQPRRDRDLVHPRPQAALDRAGERARLPARTSTTTSTSSRRRWPRSRPIAP